jgi:hypothetical protein
MQNAASGAYPSLPPSGHLHIQEWFRAPAQSTSFASQLLSTLCNSLGLVSCRNATTLSSPSLPLPLVIINYDQIASPKSHPIANECRGLCVELPFDTKELKGLGGTAAPPWTVVAKGMDRFHNYGEIPAQSQAFDWSHFTATSKEDGSYMLLYRYRGVWRVNTRHNFSVDARVAQVLPSAPSSAATSAAAASAASPSVAVSGSASAAAAPSVAAPAPSAAASTPTAESQQPMTYWQLFERAAEQSVSELGAKLDPAFTYCFELCSRAYVTCPPSALRCSVLWLSLIPSDEAYDLL